MPNNSDLKLENIDLELLLKHMSDGFAIVNKKGVFTFVNEGLAKMVNIRPEEAVGRSFSEFVDKESESRIRENLQIRFDPKTNDHPTYFVNFYDEAGAKNIALVNAAPLTNKEGEVIGSHAIITNVTELAKLEQELQKEKVRFNLALNAAEDGIWDWFTDSEKVYFSPQWKKQIGYDDDELENTFNTWASLLHPDEFERMLGSINNFLVAPQPHFIEEFRLRHKNGTYRWIRSKASCLKDEQGNVVRMFGMHSDITEERKAKHELILSEHKATSIFKGIPIPSFIWEDVAGEFVLKDYNDEVEKMHPNNREKLIGKTATELLPPDDPVKQILEEVKEKRVSVQRDASLKYPGFKEPGIFNLNCAYIEKDIYLIHAEDITQRRKAELILESTLDDLKKSNKRLEEFAFVASHDLQEPLRMVSSFMKLVEKNYKEKLDEKGKQYVHFAVEGAERMREQIKALLTYSRLYEKQESKQRVDSKELLSGVLKQFEISVKENSIDLFLPDVFPEMYCVPAQIEHVFQNLISNAIKFRKKNKAEIHIEFEQRKDGFYCSVSDNGIGISSEYHNKIFEIFQRLHSRNDFEGTGIGLAICKKVIENHQGKIWIDKEYVEGVKVVFLLPLD